MSIFLAGVVTGVVLVLLLMVCVGALSEGPP